MVLMNDRQRFPVRPPRKLGPSEPALCDVSRRVVAERMRREPYRIFVQDVENAAERARDAELESPALSEAARAHYAKSLALLYWVRGNRQHRDLARRALRAVGEGVWGGWAGAPDSMIDYLVAADLLRVSGGVTRNELAGFRERLAPKIAEGFALAPRLPQNNWRIETDSAVAASALAWWHDPGAWPVEEWLAAALDGLSRVLFGLLSEDGAYGEGPNYSRRSAIPFLHVAFMYLRLSGVDLLNHPALRPWHRWQVEVKRPDGRTMPCDDSGPDFEGYPHALLTNRLFRDAAVQRWAHERSAAEHVAMPDRPFAIPHYGVEALLLFDDRVRPRPPRWACSRVLPRSGTAIFRSGWDRRATMGLLLARPLAPFGADQVDTAHRHDDPLHFIVQAHGQLLAIDAGYGPGYLAESRYSWYLTPRAHNMILVDGEGPPRVTAYNGDCRRANVSQSSGRVRELCRTRDVFGAQAQTSYCGVDFRRNMFFVRKRYFVIVDEVESPRTHEYAWLLHGGSEEMAYRGDGGVWEAGEARLTLKLLWPSGLALRQAKGRHMAGGHDEADHTYLSALAVGRDMRFVAVLLPELRTAAPPLVQLVAQDPLSIRVKLDGGAEHVFVWNPTGRRRNLKLAGVDERQVDGTATVVSLPAAAPRK